MKGRRPAARVRGELLAGLSQRAELVVPGEGGSPCLVFQRRECDTWFAVVARRRSATSARAWVEAHYEGVRWRSPAVCTALVGRLRAGPFVVPAGMDHPRR